MSDKTKKYYEYLKGKNVNVAPTYDAFISTLQDDSKRKKYYDYLSTQDVSLAPNFEAFTATLVSQPTEQVKKKDVSESPSTTPQGVSSLESPSSESFSLTQQYKNTQQNVLGGYLVDAVKNGYITPEQVKAQDFDAVTEIAKAKAKPENQSEIDRKLQDITFNRIDNLQDFNVDAAKEKLYNESIDAYKATDKIDIAEKTKEQFISKIPEEQRTPEKLSEVEEELWQDSGIRVDLQGDDVIGETKGFVGNAVIPLQKGIEDIALATYSSILEAKESLGMPLSPNSPTSAMVRGERKDEMERLSKKMTQYEGDLLDNLVKGNFSNAGGLTLQQTAESLPLMAAAATGNPTASFFALSGLSANKHYQDVREEDWFKDLNNGEKLGYLSLYGAAEGLDLVIGGRILKNAARSTTAKNATNGKQFIKDFFKGAGYDMSEEAASEGVTGVSQYVLDQAARGEDITYKGIEDAFLRSSVGGLGGGLVMSGTARTSSLALNTPEFLKINKAEKEVLEDIKTASSPQEVNILSAKAEQIADMKAKLAKSNKQMFDNMSESDRDAYSRAMANFDSYKKQLESIDKSTPAYEVGSEMAQGFLNEAKDIVDKYDGTQDAEVEETIDAVQQEEVDNEQVVEETITEDIPKPEEVEITDFTEGVNEKEIGFHGGNLEYKAEGFGNRQKGSDVPLTGYYFYSSLDKAKSRGNRQTGKKEVKAIDFSKYNLFKPKNSSGYFSVLSALKRLPLTVDKEALSNSYDSLISKLEQSFKNGFISQEVLDNFKSKKEAVVDEIAKQTPLVEERLNKEKDNTNVLDTPETIALKQLGYEGIDVRNIEVLSGDANPDSDQYGSVIFDVKEDTVIQPKTKTTQEDAIQEPQAAELPIQEQAEVSEEVDGEVRETEVEEEAVTLKYETKETPTQFSEVEGGTRIFKEAANVYNKSLDRRQGEETSASNAVEYIKGTKAYENANDVQREAMIRSFRSEVGVREKKAPSADRLLGKPKDKKVTIKEKTALKDQIRLESKAAKEGYRQSAKEVKDYASVIKSIVDTLPKGILSSTQAKQLTNAAKGVRTPSQMRRFEKVAEKIIDKIEYSNDLIEATSLKEKLNTSAKQKTIPSNLKAIIKDFLEIKPSQVTDDMAGLERYKQLANGLLAFTKKPDIKADEKSVDVTETETVSIDEVKNFIYLSKVLNEKDLIQDAFEENQDLVEQGILDEQMSYQEIKTVLDAIDGGDADNVFSTFGTEKGKRKKKPLKELLLACKVI